MKESRDLGVTRPSENQQCHGNKALIAPSSYNTNTVGAADRDARKLEYSMRSSEYNAKNIIQTTSDHIKDVTSGCDAIPINMTASKYQLTPSYMKCDRPDNTLFMEESDKNNTTKHRKLHENVLNSDDYHIGKSSKIAKCAAVSADTFSDKMGSRSSHDFGSSFPSNEYNGYSIDGSHDDETVAHIEPSPTNSPEPFTKIHNWNIPLGNSWGSFEFSHGTLSGVLSDILTEKSGMFSDHKTPIVYSTSGRKSRSSSFNGTGGGLFHSKQRNSTNTKKFESSIKSSSMELHSNEMTNESIVLDHSKYALKKRFRGEIDDECLSAEDDDTINLTLGTRTNQIQPASLYSNNNTVVVINNNNNNSNNKNDKNNSVKQTGQGYKHGINDRINDTIHLDIITNKHDDQSNMKNDFYVFNQIGNSGSFSTEKRYGNYDLYLRSCFEGNEECSDSNTRRILKSHTKLDNMKINSPNFRLRTFSLCSVERDGILDCRFCDSDKGKEGEEKEESTRIWYRFPASCSYESDLCSHDGYDRSQTYFDHNVESEEKSGTGGRRNPCNICDDPGDELGSFSGAKRGSKRSWVETERCLSCDLFNDGEGNRENEYDHLMFGGGGGKVLFQDDDEEEEEEEEEVDKDGGGDNMDYGDNDQDHHTNNDIDYDNDHGYNGKGMEQRCSVCTETKEKKRTYDSNSRTDTNNNSNQQLHCSCYQHKEQEHYSSCHSSNFNITNKKYENLDENFRNYDENKFEIVGKIEESTTAINNDNKNGNNDCNKSRNRRNLRHSSLSHTKQLLCLKSRKLRDNSALIKNKYKPLNKKIEIITKNENENENKDGNGDGNNYEKKNNNSNVFKSGNNEYSRELN